MSAVIVLSTTARSAIVSSFVDALSANESTGSLVTQVCETARKYLKGSAMTDDDRNAVVSSIAKARGWKGPSAKSRTSECNVVLRAYHTLPEAIATFRKRAPKCQWHDSMKLARRINAGDNVTKAVSFALNKQASTPVSPQGRVAGGLKAWYKMAKRDKREAILRAAELLHIELGLKLDA